MQTNDKTVLFESAPIPSAVAKLSVPMIFSSLVMVLYNMADTYFVGMLNDPVEKRSGFPRRSCPARVQRGEQSLRASERPV